MPPFSWLKTNPWGIIVAVFIACIPMLWLLRTEIIVIGGPPLDQTAIANVEIICLFFCIIVFALLFPSMPDIDRGRPRARWSAVMRYVLGLLFIWGLAWIAARCIDLFYNEVAPDSSEVLESGLIINNALCVAGVAGIAIPLFGRLWATPLVISLWAADIAPLFFDYKFPIWPLDYFQGPGPWFDLSRITGAVILMCIGALVQWWTAGISRWAYTQERGESQV